jgi:ABC-type branched-subunit amino acid transport system ATPase component
MIHVENLVKTFGEVKAVNGVSFDVQAGGSPQRPS